MNRKPIFDAVSAMLGRPPSDDEAKTLHSAFDQAEASIAGSDLGPPQPAATATAAAGHTLGAKGVTLIQSFEGCERLRPDRCFDAYPDPGSSDGNPWTIGWGSTGPDVAKGVVWTKAQCDARFAKDMEVYAAAVSHAIGAAPTTGNQFDAMVSFHYNTGAIGRATLTKKHIAGDYEGAAEEFAKWNKNAGKVMAGLTRRRAAEAALYRTP